ncbi:lipoate--protein ligase family protein [Rhodopirellula sp. JC740]|uniref:Lipoate--protein ligase family protein n=1 Tax=Rhodopirellula halodulae TaxID=2894198 RepID=A0ABS8NND3_9BACT|nr:lipoate--protein ligase family protein [Rhodopirellula sp. JC740]
MSEGGLMGGESNAGRLRVGRLIEWQHHGAAENMATDEALLQSVAAGAPPTLRYYGWSRPTLSLGYFQSLSEAEAWAATNQVTLGESGNVDLVRRSTGGGAILHHQELTLSLTLPENTADTGAREATYRAVHTAIAEELHAMGVVAKPYRTLGRNQVSRPTDDSPLESKRRPSEPFLCFQRRTDEDLIVSGYKVLGSAQRRTKGALLQHGSLLWSVTPHAKVLPGLQELSGRTLSMSRLISGLAQRLSSVLQLEWKPGELERSEKEAADQIASQKYGNQAWTAKR